MRRSAQTLGLTLLTVTFILLLGWAGPAAAATSAPDRGDLDLLFFWGDGCPHCAAQEVWLEQAQEDYLELSVHAYEVWYDDANRAVLQEVAADLGFEPSGVPVTVLGDRHWVGWSEVVQAELTA